MLLLPLKSFVMLICILLLLYPSFQKIVQRALFLTASHCQISTYEPLQPTALTSYENICARMHSHLLATCISYSFIMVVVFLEQEEGVNITVNSLHPGGIATNIARHHSVINCKHFSIPCFNYEISSKVKLRLTMLSGY